MKLKFVMKIVISGREINFLLTLDSLCFIYASLYLNILIIIANRILSLFTYNID